MKFDDYRVHCSSIGAIMTNPRSGTGLSETCKAELMECYIREKYGRVKGNENKYIEKGNMVEEDSITLYSRVCKKLFTKNDEFFGNEFICGTPDIIDGKTVIDIKSCWSIHTFFSVLYKPMDKDYLWQINGYKALIPCDLGKLVYALVNTPDVIVEQEKSKLRYKMGLIDPDANETYIAAAAMIDKNSYFDDIPIESRYIEFEVPNWDITEVYDRVKQCREFLNKLP